MTYILIKYLHFIGIFLVVGSLFAEAWLLRMSMSRAQLKQLGNIDGIYGFASIITVAAGLIMWLSDIGKPAAFYNDNGLIYLKLGIFTIVGLLSIYPTVFFARQKQSKKNPDAEEMIQIPGPIKTVVIVELILVFTLPFWAAMMAQGISIF
ncbi:MAG: DUF2214 family protein [Cytophagales bacterium]|nr:DUF2214 family protein [Cytophagales bacterium]